MNSRVEALKSLEISYSHCIEEAAEVNEHVESFVASLQLGRSTSSPGQFHQFLIPTFVSYLPGHLYLFHTFHRALLPSSHCPSGPSFNWCLDWASWVPGINLVLLFTDMLPNALPIGSFLGALQALQETIVLWILVNFLSLCIFCIRNRLVNKAHSRMKINLAHSLLHVLQFFPLAPVGLISPFSAACPLLLFRLGLLLSCYTLSFLVVAPGNAQEYVAFSVVVKTLTAGDLISALSIFIFFFSLSWAFCYSLALRGCVVDALIWKTKAKTLQAVDREIVDLWLTKARKSGFSHCFEPSGLSGRGLFALCHSMAKAKVDISRRERTSLLSVLEKHREVNGSLMLADQARSSYSTLPDGEVAAACTVFDFLAFSPWISSRTKNWLFWGSSVFGISAVSSFLLLDTFKAENLLYFANIFWIPRSFLGSN